MKKTLLALAGLAAILSVVSCGSTPKPKMGAVADNTINGVIIDHPLKKFGQALPPDWVVSAATGRSNQKVLEKAMPELKGRKSFVVTTRAKTLDMAEQWAKEVSLNSEVAKILENNISTAAEAAMKGNENADEGSFQKELDKVVRNLSSVTFTGLELTATSWAKIQDRVMETGENVGEPYYEYYIVASVDEKIFKDLIKDSLEDIEKTTTEDEAMKDIIEQAIREQMIDEEEVEY